MYEVKDILNAINNEDLLTAPPDKEPDRQYWFIRRLMKYTAEREKELGRPLTADVVTFGCQMNARDSEKIAGILSSAGFTMTTSEESDVVVYNTCTVRENADQKVFGRLGRLKKYKEKHPDMIQVLCGCMMQEDHVVEKVKKSFGNVDIIFGTFNIYKFAELLAIKLLDPDSRDKVLIDIRKEAQAPVEELPKDRKYSFKSGVNIMFGCDNYCTYCIVPYVRGHERSRRPEDILEEICALAHDGVKEIMLLGQNVNSYGIRENTLPDRKPMGECDNGTGNILVNDTFDNANKYTAGDCRFPSFAELLKEVEKIDGIERIRFMTSNPKDLSDELIEVMKNSKKICHYLHLPLQSGSTRLLKKMNRHYSKESYLALVDHIKSAVPDITLSTDIIVGFPGETEEDFEETMDVVRRVRYNSAFTFQYSKRTGTPAAAFEDQVSQETVTERFDRLLALVQQISAEETEKRLGETVPVMIEEVDTKEEGFVTGRTDTNYIVHFRGSADEIGEIVDVTLLESKGFYFMGQRV
jgi:tRNA-2-methylthio-N6-dimethylallyladenosine synthase